MKNKWYVVMHMMCVAVCMFGCNEETKLLHGMPVTDELIVDVKEGSLSNKGLELLMQCEGADYYFKFGDETVIVEKYENGQWKEVDVVNEGPYGTYADIHYVGDEIILEHKVNWCDVYGELPSGKYRMIKAVDKIARDESDGKYCVYVEFSL